MKKLALVLFLFLLLASMIPSLFVHAAPPCGTPQGGPCPTATPGGTNPTATPSATPTGGYDGVFDTIVWADEFSGSSINLNNWTYDIGGGGWGNDEYQFYTNRPENARIENGMLVIEARSERYRGRNYTSARLKTQGLRSFTYGRVEARLQVPYGQGIWPAFWMLGSDISTVSWPNCGELDIMEHIGREPYNVFGTVHGPNYSGANGVGSFITLSQPVKDSFHVFAVEWTPTEIRWYVDGVQYHSVTPSTVPGTWVFNHDFFIILNVAVGGYWPGYPDASTTFPQRMTVDYVRVYQ